jgi:uncharacterized MAPEG superfamily protein
MRGSGKAHRVDPREKYATLAHVAERAHWAQQSSKLEGVTADGLT